MISPFDRQKGASLASVMREFLRDFAVYAGWRGVATGILVALGALLEALSLVLLIPLISLAIGSNFPSGKIGTMAAATLRFIGVEAPLARLALFLGIFAVLVIVRAVVVSFRDVNVAALQAGFVESLQLRVAQCLVGAQWDQIVRLRHARVTHLLSGDIQRIGVMTQLFLQFSVSWAMLLAQCILVLILAPIFAASSLGLLLIGAVLFLPIVRRAHALGGIMTRANLSLLDSTTQFLGGLKLALSQNLQTRFIDEFRQSLNELTKRQIEYSRQQSRVRVALATLPALAAGLLVLIGFGAFNLAPATLIALVLIITRMIGPVAQIQQALQQIIHALPAYDEARRLERDLTAVPQSRLRAVAAPPPDGAIEAHNVTFRHASDDGGESARGVEGVSVTLQPGEMVGVSGPSGAGKTTFADLLVGLFPPQHGRIAVGGLTLEGGTLVSWRDRVSYVSQDPFLFHDTVRRNLNWANPQSDEPELWQALALVGAEARVRGMELGLDTVVGERGTLLSGGERQRIALARAILRKPRLLLLDEATGAIDIAGERAILEALRLLQPRPTIVIIAHRVESLALCERVLRFEGGRCVDETTGADAAYRSEITG